MLGCTYLEMYTVLLGRSLAELPVYGPESRKPVAFYRASLEPCRRWLSELDGLTSDPANLICDMMNKDPGKRPDAVTVLGRLQKCTVQFGGLKYNFCGSFCRRSPLKAYSV